MSVAVVVAASSHAGVPLEKLAAAACVIVACRVATLLVSIARLIFLRLVVV